MGRWSYGWETQEDVECLRYGQRLEVPVTLGRTSPPGIPEKNHKEGHA